jgi:hypothetical protein
MNLALARPPLPWIASASLLALVAVLAAAIIQPLALLAASGTAALGAALALAAPWRRFHAAKPAARAAFIGS